MKIQLVLFFNLWIMLFTATAQEAQFPFPQNVTYPYGFMPTTFSTEDFEKWYSSFRSNRNFFIDCGGGRIATASDNTSTIKVEAMGWGMILTAYMGDKETFDGLYAFYKSKLKSHGMMDWKVSCNGGGDGGSASDGDLDVAFSMVVASWQWGDSYREEAIKLINTVEKLITDCNGTSVIVGGYGGHGTSPYGGCNATDISYYTPAFFRVFAEFTENEAWEKLADDTYIVLNNAANDQTGLVPDWHTWEGGRASGHSNQYSYSYDACRVPWRITLDYLWNGNEQAKEWCNTIAEWANGKGAANIGSNYNLDGSGGGGWPGMSFLGGFAVATMAYSQEAADAFGEQVAKTNFDNYWYHAYLGTMYMLTMSGNMWRPELDDATTSSVSGKHIRKNMFSVKNIANRELVLSGVASGSSVSLVSLAGKRVKYIASVAESNALLDISTIKAGCYLLSIVDTNAKQHATRMISLF